MAKRKKGFTLVELLVVVAIIALLVSILLPTLGKAKEQTRIVVCLTQLRSLGLSFTQYSAENDGWYPAGAACGGLAYGMTRGSVTGPEYTWDTILFPYYQNHEMIHCPSDKLSRTVAYEPVPQDCRYPRSYAINFNVSHMGPSVDGENNGYWGSIPPYPWPGNVHKTTEVSDPGETVLLADMWEWWSWYSNNKPWPGIYGAYQAYGTGIGPGGDSLISGREPTYYHRNSDSANFLFCDGHAIPLGEDDPGLTSENNYHYWWREK